MSRKQLEKSDIVGALFGFGMATIIFQISDFGIIPAFVIAMVSYWTAKKIANMFMKVERDNRESGVTQNNGGKDTSKDSRLVNNEKTSSIGQPSIRRKTTWGWYALGYIGISLIIIPFIDTGTNSITSKGFGYNLGSVFAPGFYAFIISIIAYQFLKKKRKSFGSVFLLTYLVFALITIIGNF